MQPTGALDFVPLPVLFAVTIGIVYISAVVGSWLGRRRRQQADAEKEGPVGTVAGSMMGLLGFMLAFTFGLAAARFDTRRQTLLVEANDIGTCYLRVDLVPAADRPELRKLLREYVDIRLGVHQGGDLNAALQRSEAIHGLLWSRAAAIAEKTPQAVVTGLFIQSLNEVIDDHSKRVAAAFQGRIPAIVWLVLYMMLVLSLLALGYQTGLIGSSQSPVVLVLAFSLGAVLVLIADLDRPGEGYLRVSPQALIELRSSMNEPLP